MYSKGNYACQHAALLLNSNNVLLRMGQRMFSMKQMDWLWDYDKPDISVALTLGSDIEQQGRQVTHTCEQLNDSTPQPGSIPPKCLQWAIWLGIVCTTILWGMFARILGTARQYYTMCTGVTITAWCTAVIYLLTKRQAPWCHISVRSCPWLTCPSRCMPITPLCQINILN